MPEKIKKEKPLVGWVDDDKEFQGLVREWLMPHYDLATYNNGEEFLEALGGMEPDAVILDVRMPGPDGFRLCRKLRADKRFTSVPILFLTSCGEDVDYIKHLDVGGTAYLNKPVEKPALLKTLRELLTFRPKPETLRWGV
jgi:DNA-binding response OmpR family regulator